MSGIVLLGTRVCPNCDEILAWLKEKDIPAIKQVLDPMNDAIHALSSNQNAAITWKRQLSPGSLQTAA